MRENFEGRTKMHCIECGFTGNTFNVKIDDLHSGHLTFKAVCPKCDSDKITFVGLIYYEKNLRITIDSLKEA